MEDEFKEKNDLIQGLLERADLGFEEGMTREDREDRDLERQMFVLQLGYNAMTVEELRNLSQQ